MSNAGVSASGELPWPLRRARASSPGVVGTPPPRALRGRGGSRARRTRRRRARRRVQRRRARRAGRRTSQGARRRREGARTTAADLATRNAETKMKRRRRGRPSSIRAGRARGRLGDERDRLPLHRGGGGGGGGGGSSRVFPPGFRACAVFIFCRRLRRLPGPRGGAPAHATRRQSSQAAAAGGGAPAGHARASAATRAAAAPRRRRCPPGRCLEEFRNRAPRGLRPGCPVAARRRSFRSNLRRRFGIRRYLVSALGDESLLLRAPPDARRRRAAPKTPPARARARALETRSGSISVSVSVSVSVSSSPWHTRRRVSARHAPTFCQNRPVPGLSRSSTGSRRRASTRRRRGTPDAARSRSRNWRARRNRRAATRRRPPTATRERVRASTASSARAGRARGAESRVVERAQRRQPRAAERQGVQLASDRVRPPSRRRLGWPPVARRLSRLRPKRLDASRRGAVAARPRVEPRPYRAAPRLAALRRVSPSLGKKKVSGKSGESRVRRGVARMRAPFSVSRGCRRHRRYRRRRHPRKRCRADTSPRAVRAASRRPSPSPSPESDGTSARAARVAAGARFGQPGAKPSRRAASPPTVRVPPRAPELRVDARRAVVARVAVLGDVAGPGRGGRTRAPL